MGKFRALKPVAMSAVSIKKAAAPFQLRCVLPKAGERSVATAPGGLEPTLPSFRGFCQFRRCFHSRDSKPDEPPPPPPPPQPPQSPISLFISLERLLHPTSGPPFFFSREYLSLPPSLPSLPSLFLLTCIRRQSIRYANSNIISE